MVDYDLAIIGGGLNGVSIARDAAGRGLRVILLEQDDLGSAASSASPRLVHGDLAMLERRGFLRVRAALAERDVWLRRRTRQHSGLQRPGSFGDWLLQQHTIWGITVQNWMGPFLIYVAPVDALCVADETLKPAATCRRAPCVPTCS